MAILSVVTVSMIAVIVGLCARQRRHQKRQIVDRNMAESAADFQENSIDNPMYGGMAIT